MRNYRMRALQKPLAGAHPVAHARTLARRRENESVGFTPMLFGYEIAPFL